MDQWWHSPQCVLGLWPEWFGPIVPDWPGQTRLCGFPLYDEKDDDDERTRREAQDHEASLSPRTRSTAASSPSTRTGGDLQVGSVP